jgi:hypothetical protein
MRETDGEKARERNLRWMEALWEGTSTTASEENQKEEVLAGVSCTDEGVQEREGGSRVRALATAVVTVSVSSSPTPTTRTYETRVADRRPCFRGSDCELVQSWVESAC